MLKKEYNESYVKKWLYFDNLHQAIKQAEIEANEISFETLEISGGKDKIDVTFDEQFNDYFNNAKISFEEIIENERLSIAYKKLTDREKLVIDLCFRQRFTQNQIANIIGIQRCSVSRIVKRAVEKLRDLMC